jgi:regulator of sigma E protease
MILQSVLQVIIGLLILGILVLVHEFGHFVAAKAFGVRVLSFSIGFGKALLRKRIGETEYRISAIPFGGFVHMAGEHPEDDHEQQPDEFPSKPIWQRGVIAFAGPAFNYVSAVVFLWFAFVVGMQVPTYLDTPAVGDVLSDSPAATAGIQPGDTVVSINGRRIDSWREIENAIGRLDDEYTVVVRREGEHHTYTIPSVTPEGKNWATTFYAAGMLPSPPPVIGEVQDDSPAARAGLQPDDSVIAIDSERIVSWAQLSSRVAAWDSTRSALRLSVARGDTVRSFSMTPYFDEQLDRYRIGMTAAEVPTRTRRLGPLAAIPASFARSGDMIILIGNTLKQLFTARISPKELAGPIGIVQMSGGMALLGLVPVLNFMALIGINLALLNLLPLIITDGGMLLFLGIEAVRGKPLSLQAQLIVNRIAIALFLMLFVYVTFNDILRLPRFFGMATG